MLATGWLPYDRFLFHIFEPAERSDQDHGLASPDLPEGQTARPYLAAYMHVSRLGDFVSHHRPLQSGKSPGFRVDSLLNRFLCHRQSMARIFFEGGPRLSPPNRHNVMAGKEVDTEVRATSY